MTSIRASDLAARRIQETRRERGWRATDLAAECKRSGAPEITIAVIANIETGRRGAEGSHRRRDLTIDEFLVLAYVLGVRPADLLDAGGYEHIAIMPGFEVPARHVAAWVRGQTWAPIPTLLGDGFACCGSCGVAVRVEYDDDSAIYRYYCANGDCAQPVACPVKEVDDSVRQRVLKVMESAGEQGTELSFNGKWDLISRENKRKIIHTLIKGIAIFPEKIHFDWAWDYDE